MNEIAFNVVVSLYLDKSKHDLNNKHLLRLQVYDKKTKKRLYFATKFKFTENEYKQIMNSKKTTPKKAQLNAILLHAQTIANEIKPFNFEIFKQRLYQMSGASDTILQQFKNYITELEKENRLNYAQTFQQTINCITEYFTLNKKNIEKVKFIDITPHILKELENFMLSQNKSVTTVAIHMRNIRTIFNIAIDTGIVSKDDYPFGRRRYVIPSTTKVKKALTKSELKILFEAQPQTPEQEKAKDFWFFSYACNGMNIKDIALLKYENIDNDILTFYRKKTINTKRECLKPITVALNDYVLSIINKYGKKNAKPSDLIFSILTGNETPREQQRKIKNFTRFINQHIKILAKNVGLTPEISTYWARHSFATIAIRSGLPMEFVSEALGHSDIKTTQTYFAGFTNDTKKEFSKKLMDF